MNNQCAHLGFFSQLNKTSVCKWQFPLESHKNKTKNWLGHRLWVLSHFLLGWFPKVGRCCCCRRCSVEVGGRGWDTLTVAIWAFISGTRNGLALARRTIQHKRAISVLTSSKGWFPVSQVCFSTLPHWSPSPGRLCNTQNEHPGLFKHKRLLISCNQLTINTSFHSRRGELALP